MDHNGKLVKTKCLMEQVDMLHIYYKVVNENFEKMHLCVTVLNIARIVFFFNILKIYLNIPKYL